MLIQRYQVYINSDLFNGDDMMGIILYQYDGKTEWEINGIKCKSGFIYLCKSSKLKNVKSNPIDTMHARCYKYLFGVDPDYRKIVGAGCGFKDNEWKYNSSTFCAPDNRQNIIKDYYGMDEFKDEWHDNDRSMHEIEKKLLTEAAIKWIEFSEEVMCISWSWHRSKWMDYDQETNKYIEYEYRKYLRKSESIRDDTYFIELNTNYFKTNGKVKETKYNIYFSAPKVSINPESIHSRHNALWSNDNDENNKYFLQQNENLKRWRIVRRRKGPSVKKRTNDCIIL